MKEKGKETDHVSIRLTSKELARIKKFISEFSRPWREATLSDVIRMLIRIGLENAGEIVALRGPPKTKVKRGKRSNPSPSRQRAPLVDAADAPLQEKMHPNDDSK